MEDADMPNVAVPVQDEREADWAAEQAIKLYRFNQARIHLLNVQHPLPRHVSRFFSGADLADFHRENGMLLLEPVIRKLDAAEVPHKVHVLTGHEAETIVHFAEEYACTRIVMESRPEGLLSVLGLGAISSQVSHLMRARNMSIALGAVQV
jgi:nucleotide-binding universal stress UspA family protein